MGLADFPSQAEINRAEARFFHIVDRNADLHDYRPRLGVEEDRIE
jgi:hypothetical protein